MIRAAIYAWISSDRDGDHLCVRRQVDDCERLIARKGWKVAERYVDDDVSVYNGRVRQRIGGCSTTYETAISIPLWSGMQTGCIGSPKELEEFFDVCREAGVTRLAPVSGDIDLATHGGQFVARILGALARKESDDKSRRIRRKHK